MLDYAEDYAEEYHDSGNGNTQTERETFFWLLL